MCRGPCHVRCGTVGASVVARTHDRAGRGLYKAVYTCHVVHRRPASSASRSAASLVAFLYTIVIRYPNRTSLGLFIFRFHCAPAAELHVSGASCAPGARGAQRQTDSAHATTDIEMSYVTTAHQSPCRCHSRTHHGAGHAGPTPRDATSSSEHKQDSTQTSHLTSPHSHKPAPSPAPERAKNLVRL